MPEHKTKLGILLPTRGILLGESPPGDANLVLNLAQKVEQAGLDSVWVGDSLTAKPRLEPLSTLSAIAAVTQRVRLGTAVLLMALRHPLLLAQTMATVDLISRGRLVIAAGAGGAFNDEQKQEWENAGVKASQRGRRLEEMVQIIKGLGSGNPLTFQGRHFDLSSVVMKPQLVHPKGVPILLACHWRAPAKDRQVQRAARWADGLISISDTPEEYGQVVQQVRAAAAELGRDPDGLEAVMYLTVNLDQDRARAYEEAERWLLGYYGANIWGTRWGPFGDIERVKDRLAEYADAGAQTLVVRFASFEPERQLEIFLDKVAPAFQC
jgi:alkanesulfonate monooxygenase SsuD/methylene tetrahydromethanopterin reductase-like flavin-dependent oxidoreductase (luciferase family)